MNLRNSKYVQLQYIAGVCCCLLIALNCGIMPQLLKLLWLIAKKEFTKILKGLKCYVYVGRVFFLFVFTT